MSLLLAAGCAGRVELPDVPIEGGTAEQRELVRHALLQFDEQAGPGRVVLRSVHIYDIDDEDIGGQYIASRVRLDEALGDGELMESTFHELCHALDLQHELLRGSNSVIDELTDGMKTYDPELDKGSARHETFARFCALGPLAAIALAEDRWGALSERYDWYDRRLRTDLGAWLLDEVWQGRIELDTYTWTSGDSVRATFYSGSSKLSGTADPRVVHVQTDDEATHADLYTGAEVESDLPPAAAPTTPPPGMVGPSFDPDRNAGWPEGPWVGFVTWSAYHLMFIDQMWVYHDGETWYELDPEGELSGSFVADDQLWMSWYASDTKMHWAPLSDGD